MCVCVCVCACVRACRAFVSVFSVRGFVCVSVRACVCWPRPAASAPPPSPFTPHTHPPRRRLDGFRRGSVPLVCLESSPQGAREQRGQAATTASLPSGGAAQPPEKSQSQAGEAPPEPRLSVAVSPPLVSRTVAAVRSCACVGVRVWKGAGLRVSAEQQSASKLSEREKGSIQDK